MAFDFSELYTQLGLEPGCTLDELKRAYRRRIAKLHPDRQAHAPSANTDSPAQLASLTALYKNAMRFHHTHGRLPGNAASNAAPASATDARNTSATASNGDTQTSRTIVQSRPTPEQRPTTIRGQRLILLILLALIAYLVLSAIPWK